VAIFFYSEQVEVPPLLKSRTKIFLKSIINEESFLCGEISVIFCSDKFLLNINKKYLQHNYYTDILAFDYTSGKIASGDIYISIERVTENADKFNVSFNEELYRIMFHGILHLLGYSDKNEKDKEIMTLKEDYYLKNFFSSH
jgi:probable rRNA maturation factor